MASTTALSTISMTVIESVSEANASPNAARRERTQGKRVAEEKGKDDGEGDRDRVPPPKHGSQNQTQYFPDRATGQAVDRGRKGKTVK